MSSYDAVVVGAGPNGLSAAIVLARAGLSVLVLEGADTIGGGTRSEALTLPGFVHDVCSGVHPMAAGSPLFSVLPLERYGLAWVEPPIALAHPLHDGPPALLSRSIDATASSLGDDGAAYRALIEPFASRWHDLAPDVLAPLHVPRHPLLLARFGLHAAQSIARLVRRHFSSSAAQSLLGGIAAHALQPLQSAGTAALALILASLGHRVGWPIARGGSAAIARALASYFADLGGRIEVARRVRSLGDLPRTRTTLLDLSPRQVIRLCGDSFPRPYARALGRFRYGPGVFKVDWALSAPVPWAWPECREAGTLHLAGSLAALCDSESRVARNEHPEHPTVLVSQPSRFDPTRSPDGFETLWGYCHVPHGSTVDMLPRIERQIERFAPGFRDCVRARHIMNTADLERREPNMIGGDIAQGANTLRQLFLRPVARINPYATPVRGLYLCSSSTPPGAGVHGMCGYYAAKSALHDVFHLSIDRSITLSPPS